MSPPPSHTARLALSDAEGKDAAAGEANRKQLASLLDEAEAQLGVTPFLAGEAYSVADVMFTPLLFRLGMANKTGEYLKPRPNVSKYYSRWEGGGTRPVGAGAWQLALLAARRRGALFEDSWWVMQMQLPWP